MNRNIHLLAASLFIMSSMAVVAKTSGDQAQKASCCMVANGCAKHSKKNIEKIDDAVSQLDSVRSSEDPKKLHEALDIAYKSLAEVKADEGKNNRAMRALYEHLTKVEQNAKQLDGMLSGDGLDANFIITE